jgi:hypothetical protein
MLLMPKRKYSVGHFSAFVEDSANRMFVDCDPLDVPCFTFVCELWGRFTLFAVLDQRASEVPLITLDRIRKNSQKKYKRPVCLVMYLNPKEWDWKRAEKRIAELITEHGSENCS